MSSSNESKNVNKVPGSIGEVDSAFKASFLLCFKEVLCAEADQKKEVQVTELHSKREATQDKINNLVDSLSNIFHSKTTKMFNPVLIVPPKRNIEVSKGKKSQEEDSNSSNCSAEDMNEMLPDGDVVYFVEKKKSLIDGSVLRPSFGWKSMVTNTRKTCEGYTRIHKRCLGVFVVKYPVVIMLRLLDNLDLSVSMLNQCLL